MNGKQRWDAPTGACSRWRASWRGAVRTLLRLPVALAVSVPLLLGGLAEAWANKATARGAEMSGYGRAIFTFDELPRTTVRVSSGILILSFDTPVVLNEKLVMELPNYVSAIRLDPDGKALRMALARAVRPNMMEAGEKLFLDLLPETWKGTAPSLPPDVVEDLSRRAREAEEAARRLAKKMAASEEREITFKVGSTPTFNRVAFELPVVAPVDLVKGEERVELIFEGNLRVNVARLKSQLPAFVTGAEAQLQGGALHLALDLAPGSEVRGFREDDTYTIDLVPPKAPMATAGKDTKDGKPDPKDAKAKPDDKARPKGETIADLKPVTAADEPGPESAPKGEGAGKAGPAPAPTPAVPVTVPLAPMPQPKAAAAEVAVPSGDVAVEASVENDTARLTLKLPPKVPLVVFERAGVLWIGAEIPGAFDPSKIGIGAPGLASFVDARRQGRLSILRVGLAKPTLVRAAATDAGWVVTLGDQVAGPSEPIELFRDSDAEGRNAVRARFKDVSGVHWVDDPEVGDRFAAVTGSISPHSLVKPQGFVDFRAPATAQGLVVVPQSDDVAVKVGLDDVIISRDGGLALSIAKMPAPTAGRDGGVEPVVNAEQWVEARAGDVRDRGRELMRAAADAPRRTRASARMAFAKFQVANGLGTEAMGTLQVAAADEPDLAKDRGFVITSAIAQLQADRSADAAKLLQIDLVKDDPEAVLWRAYADAKQKRWPQALAGFRRSATVLSNYPEDLQGSIGLAYAEAAIEGRDFGLAQRVLDGLDGFDAGTVDREQMALLQARVAEGQGRAEDAMSGYDKLVRTAARPVEAEAKLRGIALGLKDNSIERSKAIEALEGLSVSWRGSDVEVQTLGLLGRLYAEDERWRDAFSMAHKANELFPDHEVTRTLYDETGSRFEALFLDGKADSIPRLDAIALYFDFKDFTPPGRRGDEMIRRLAERLEQLDLLSEAADLLQHQVDNRLSGVAKASVATRLAIIQLLNHQPAKAYQALRESKLADLPSDLRRSRSLIEARALSDLSRTDLAMEMLAPEKGPEVERLRADILWQSRRWREAGEQFERILGDTWQNPDPLDERARADVLRAAIAYGLGDETLSLERLRAKFSPKMADSADARAFTVLTSPASARASEYRDLAKSVANADTLGEFLTEYRKRYPDVPVLPPKRPKPQPQPQATEEAKPGADKAKGEKPADKPGAEKPGAEAAAGKPGEKPPAEKAADKGEKPAAAAEQKPAGGHG